MMVKEEYFRFPIYEKCITSRKAKEIVLSWGICLPEPYKYLQHNNCIPCFKGAKKHFYKIWRYYPEYFAKAVDIEKRIGGINAKYGHFYTIFKDITLEELAKQWENQKGQQEFEFEEDTTPCLCSF